MRVRSKVTGHEYEWEMHEYNLMLERNGMRYHEIVKEEVNYDNDKNTNNKRDRGNTSFEALGSDEKVHAEPTTNAIRSGNGTKPTKKRGRKPKAKAKEA